MSLPLRRPAGARRARRPPRRRVGLDGWRLLGAALMLVAGGALAWLLVSDEFELQPSRVAINELRFTDPALVQAQLQPWLDGHTNVFLLPAAEIERALAGLPAVARAEVKVSLPDRLLVSVVERVPVFVWRTDGSDYLVDATGVVLREALENEALPAELPLVDDGRPRDAQPRPGDVFEPVDLQAVLKLGAVDPALLESTAQWLSLSVERDDGYVLTAEPAGWRAVFGHYTPSLRPPEIIERQVQCLRALLAQDEERLETIYLAPAEERCGTFVGRGTPEPSPEPGDGGEGSNGGNGSERGNPGGGGDDDD